VGFAIRGDIEKLCASFPHMPCFQVFTSVIDLYSLASIVFPNTSKYVYISLRKLCAFVLKKNLDKSQQCSPWHVRPLSKAQIEYAALDAAIVQLLFKTMLERIDLSSHSRKLFLKQYKYIENSFRFEITEMIDKDEVIKFRNKKYNLKVILGKVMVTQSWHTFEESPSKIPFPKILSDIELRNASRKIAHVPKLKLSTLPIDETKLVIGSNLGTSKENVMRSLITVNVTSRLPNKFKLAIDVKNNIFLMKNGILLFVDKSSYEFSDEGELLNLNGLNIEEQTIIKTLFEDLQGTSPRNLFLIINPQKNFYIFCGHLSAIHGDGADVNLEKFTFRLTDISHIKNSAIDWETFQNFMDARKNFDPHDQQMSLDMVSANLNDLPPPGSIVGRTKANIIQQLIDEKSLTDSFHIIYNTRSGIIEMSNAVLFFINCLGESNFHQRKYRNLFMDNGRIVTFSIDTSITSKDILSESSSCKEKMEEHNRCNKVYLLYAKSGVNKKFIFCGTCQCTPGVEDSESKILEVSLKLLDYDLILDEKDNRILFQEMIDMHNSALKQC